MQPLSRVKPDTDLTHWGLPGAMEKRPALAAKVAQCISLWSEVEVRLGMFLSLLLHANQEAMLAIYSALDNRSAQLRAVESAALATLPTAHADTISALLTVKIRPAMKHRDKLAHWVWGHTEELPDALLIQDAANLLPIYSMVLDRQAATGLTDVPHKFDRIFVIREDDLDRFIKSLTEILLLMQYAMGSVWSRNDPQARDGFHQQLASEPEIRSSLFRLAESRRRTQEAHQPSHPRDQSSGS